MNGFKKLLPGQTLFGQPHLQVSGLSRTCLGFVQVGHSHEQVLKIKTFAGFWHSVSPVTAGMQIQAQLTGSIISLTPHVISLGQLQKQVIGSLT